MKKTFLLACLFLNGLVTAHTAEPISSEAQQLLALVKEVQTQQATIATNQSKIEEKVAVVGEAVRVARIYSSRSGH